MAVHVDEMTSEVTTESGAPAANAEPPKQWQERARVREMQAQIARDTRRTAAENYDD